MKYINQYTYCEHHYCIRFRIQMSMHLPLLVLLTYKSLQLILVGDFSITSARLGFISNISDVYRHAFEIYTILPLTM